MIDALRMYFIIHIIDIVTSGNKTDGVLPLTLRLSGGQDVSCDMEEELTREVHTQKLYRVIQEESALLWEMIV